ncbi:hypothetical protein [Prosthecomicrobium pneumaticum]|uniref:Uncharacterized protein n=1 Tax=Prosthecomicrobium pneumaticum TaxID=81895 RepID=A0A7W9FJ52_9HYPH|nr:hypothetical protein [Prosthecomicrobium pneumaticum]MBB5751150.1 hypothetical protein [Prosthecomicrobium pneumaticum]
MRGLRIFLAAAMPLVAGSPALAAEMPYTPVTVTYDRAGADAEGLVALVKRLTDAVRTGDIATIREFTAPELALYAPSAGFPEGDSAAALPNPDGRPGLERLAQAVMMTTTGTMELAQDELDGMVVAFFADALESGSLGRAKGAGGAICAPAEPQFDRNAGLAIADAAGVTPDDLWILPAATGFRDRPDPAAEVAVTLPAGTIAPYLSGSVDGTDGSSEWYEVALPSGKPGFARDDQSLALVEPRVCFGEIQGRWLVTALVVPQL